MITCVDTRCQTIIRLDDLSVCVLFAGYRTFFAMRVVLVLAIGDASSYSERDCVVHVVVSTTVHNRMSI